MSEFAPRRISDVETPLDISGHFMPWSNDGDQPLMLGTSGTEDCFIPLFSTVEALEAFSSLFFRNVVWKVKHIDDGLEMLNSLPYWLEPGIRLRVMVDPWVHESGSIRFKEILREEPDDGQVRCH